MVLFSAASIYPVLRSTLLEFSAYVLIHWYSGHGHSHHLQSHLHHLHRLGPRNESITHFPGKYCSNSLLLFSHSVVSNSFRPHGLQHSSLPHLPLSPKVCPNVRLFSWNIQNILFYAIHPSHPLLSPSPPTLNLTQHQAIFQ